MICPTPIITLMLCIPFAPIQTAAWSTPSSPSSPSSPPQHGVASVSDDASHSRKQFLRRILAVNGALLTASSITTSTSPQSPLLRSSSSSLSPFQPPLANAAPPFAIMEEEMGYYPMKTSTDETIVMVPSKVKRRSTPQAIALAQYLRAANAKMYGAYWCPHCSRQKELFGAEAWAYLEGSGGYVGYVECAPKGYKSQFAACAKEGVEGYPEWKFGNGKSAGGEMELTEIAKASGFLDSEGGKFDGSLETSVPSLGGAACQ
mmetsp:Transcript_9933/g.18111  ORF Transcript_9933/g.18111 Transcript_9933/m.18111 type:complete len:261 (+) Transcript_9933:56-838(+)